MEFFGGCTLNVIWGDGLPFVLNRNTIGRLRLLEIIKRHIKNQKYEKSKTINKKKIFSSLFQYNSVSNTFSTSKIFN